MLRNYKYDVVVPVNTISQQVVRESEVLGHSQPQSDFESSLNYKGSYFKKKIVFLIHASGTARS